MLDFPDRHTLEKFGIEVDRFAEFQVLVLPENLFYAGSRKDLFDVSEGRHLAKLLRSSGLRSATLFDFGLDVRLLERWSRDTRVGLIWVRDIVILPTIVGVLSSLIATEIGRSSEPRVQPKVHVDLCIERGPNLTKIHYEGDGQTLIEMLRTINTGKDDSRSGPVSKSP
jgi:hypothetical protein